MNHKDTEAPRTDEIIYLYKIDFSVSLWFKESTVE